MKNLKLLIIGLITMTLFGCYVAPYGIYDLKVADESSEILWLKGKELLKITNDTAEVIVNYETSKKGMLMFEVSISNISNDIVLVSPEDFYCDVVTKFDKAIQINALNPELMIDKYNKRIAEIEASQSSNARSDLLFSMFEVADSFRSKTEEEIEKERIERIDREESDERRANKQNYNQKKMSEERDFYEVKSLRKTSLLPGKTMGGRIYFAIPDDIKEFSLNIPIKEDEFKIKYNIKKI